MTWFALGSNIEEDNGHEEQDHDVLNQEVMGKVIPFAHEGPWQYYVVLDVDNENDAIKGGWEVGVDGLENKQNDNIDSKEGNINGKTEANDMRINLQEG